MVEGCKDIVNKLILENRGTFEDEWTYSIPYYDVNGVYRLDHAVTAVQKDILQAFNMTAATVRKEAVVLAEQPKFAHFFEFIKNI